MRAYLFWFWIVLAVLAVFVYFSFFHNDVEWPKLLKQHKLPDDLLPDFGSGNSFAELSVGERETIYGEIMVDGMRVIAGLAAKHGIKVFYDMGCGIGRTLLMARMLGFERAVGMDIVASRIEKALKWLARIEYHPLAKNIHIYEGDCTRFPVREREPVMVFVSNLLWSDATTEALFVLLDKHLQPGSIVISSKYPRASSDKIPGLPKEGTIMVPMSWFKHSECYIARKI